MRKIVYIIGGLYGPTGMGRVLSIKANYFANKPEYKVYVILTENRHTNFYYKMSPNISFINFGINFDDLDMMPAYKKFIYYIIKVRRYKSFMENFLISIKPDITVSAMRREINFLNDIPDGSKKVGEIHFSRIGYREVNIKSLPNFINKFISKIWFDKLLKEIKRLSAFVVLTEEDKRNWPLLPNIHVINNPLSFEPHSVSNCEFKKIIVVGRYDPIKGYDKLLKAWNIVTVKHHDWMLNIYGGGNSADLREAANKMNISSSFICNGSVQDIESKYIESSFLVLSSKQEGFGMVLVEAMACGLPCVSFDCPCGPHDIIQDGMNGFLVENGNIEQLAERINYMIEHSDERKRMGEQAKKSVDRFNMDVIGPQWENLFNEVLYR